MQNDSVITHVMPDSRRDPDMNNKILQHHQSAN